MHCSTLLTAPHLIAARLRGALGVAHIMETRLSPALHKHVMIAGVDAANLVSLQMHERLGFERVAHFREVGRKFDRWLDLVFLQRYVD